MRFFSIALFAGYIAFAAAQANCSAGKGRDSRGNCSNCAANTFNAGNSPNCSPCPAGSSSTRGDSYCTCDPGFYLAPNGRTTGAACNACEAGYISNSSGNACTACNAGTFAEGDKCTPCSPGYTSGTAAASCSPVCSTGYRWYLDRGTIKCQICPAGTYAGPGASMCTPCPLGQTSTAGSGSCSPRPSNLPRAPSPESLCTGRGKMWCEVWSGMGGSECIDVLSNLDSCGGCVGPEGVHGNYTGQDCSAIPNVDQVGCVHGKCKIKSCRKGYELEGSLCVKQLVIHSRVARRSTHRDSF